MNRCRHIWFIPACAGNTEQAGAGRRQHARVEVDVVTLEPHRLGQTHAGHRDQSEYGRHGVHTPRCRRDRERSWRSSRSHTQSKAGMRRERMNNRRFRQRLRQAAVFVGLSARDSARRDGEAGRWSATRAADPLCAVPVYPMLLPRTKSSRPRCARTTGDSISGIETDFRATFAEQFGTLVPSIYEQALEPDRLTPMLGQTAGLLGTSYCGLTLSHPVVGIVQTGSPDFDPAFVRSYHQHLGSLDPVVPRVAAAGIVRLTGFGWPERPGPE